MQLRNIVPSWFELQRLIVDKLSRRTHDHVYGHTHSSGSHTHSASHHAQNVHSAFREALPIAERTLRQRFADLDIDDVLSELLDIVSQAALIMAASMLTGAAVGAGVGALAGGVGAVPGAFAGSALALTASGWILGVLGLAAVAEFFVNGLPQIAEYYWRGIQTAWGASQPRGPFYCGDPFAVGRAAREIAQGHVAMATLLLSAIVAYLTRGRGPAQALASEMQRGASGAKLAQWMLKHEDALKKRPDLKPRGPDQGRLDPLDPSTPRPGQRQHEATPVKKPLVMAEHPVPCFKADKLPTEKIPEFDRQLNGQQGGLNDLTVEEYLKGRAAFRAGDVVRDPRVAAKARLDLADSLFQDLNDVLQEQGMTLHEAKQTAKHLTNQKMSLLAALHNPDLFAGGKDKISDFGDRQVNSSIGAQWRGRISGLDEAAKRTDANQRVALKLNAKLTRCK